MHIDELRIDDFGCLRNARLDDLSHGLVVIGGPQRAGKTTFMQALRQFPDGVSRGGDIPPATDEYRIDAEITHDGHQYRYVLSGHASPSVSPIDDGPEIEANDIFGPVTARQYRNLYTISIDELRKIPPDINNSEDLASVLLGGAYGDIAEIPELQKQFKSDAHDIGLTSGNPSAKTTQLNDPYKKIRSGMNARNEASKQVDEHREVSKELEEKRDDQAEIEAEIDEKRLRRDRLNVLSEIFDPLREMDGVDAELEDVDVEGIEEFPTHLADRLQHFEKEFDEATTALTEARQEFERNANLEVTDEYRAWLLENEDRLEDFEEDLNLWWKTLDDLTDEDAELQERRTEIETEISALHAHWDGSFDHIEAIETNVVDTARVADLVSNVEGLLEDENNLKKNIKSARSRKERLQSELSDMEDSVEETQEISVSKREPAIIAAVAIVVGTGVGLLTSPIVGGVVGLLVLAAGIYAVDSTITVEPTVDTDPYREVKSQITNLKVDIDADRDQLDTIQDRLEDKQAELNDLTSELGLPSEIPPTEVASFYQQVVELDDSITEFHSDQGSWEDELSEFAEDIGTVASVLEEVTEVSWSKDDPLQDAQSVLSTLDDLTADLELARDVRIAENKRTNHVEEIDSVLTEWDTDRSVESSTDDQTILEHVAAFRDEAERVNHIQGSIKERDGFETQVTNRVDSPSAQEAFEPLRDGDEPWMDVVRRAAEVYTDTDAIKDEIKETKSEIDQLTDHRDELQEECLRLENNLEELASEDDLHDAQAMIDEGRVEFERLGEAYSVNRIAEEMVRQLHERLMQDVVHSLIDDASMIFSEITQEYDGISLEEDIQNLGFRALRGDGPDHGVGELSRATGEQLFLAIRLARIRQTDVKLPVVLDDAATNFDPNHVSRVFSIVDEFVSTNQVFFLTCHPECIRITSTNDPDAQLWSLEASQFTRMPDPDTLEQRLSAD